MTTQLHTIIVHEVFPRAPWGVQDTLLRTFKFVRVAVFDGQTQLKVIVKYSPRWNLLSCRIRANAGPIAVDIGLEQFEWSGAELQFKRSGKLRLKRESLWHDPIAITIDVASPLLQSFIHNLHRALADTQ